MGYKLRSMVVLVVVLVVSTSAVAQAAVPIPAGPGHLLVDGYIGAPSTAAPVESSPVPQNPHLAPNGDNSMHNDAYATDAYATGGPVGRSPRVASATYGISECATVAFDRAGRMVGLCGDLIGPELKLIDPDTLDQLASHRLPPRQPRPGVTPLEDLCGGAYFYLDNYDRAVIATTDRRIVVVAYRDGFALERSYDLTAAIPSDDCLIALMPDWAGRIWFETAGGVVGTVDPDSGRVETLKLSGETIANSFSTDESGGAFVVTTHALHRLDASAAGAPEVTWRQPYDRGSVRKPGQLSQGSGTTPTLVGEDLVAITDNADPRMNVRVYQRGSGAPVCSAPVFEPRASATENSLVAVGNGLIVENNYGYTGPQATLLGKTTSPGIAKVDVEDGQCTVAWTNPSSAPTSVPKASLETGLVYAYTKPANRLGIDAWYLTAINLHTGRTEFSKLTGTGPQFNNHYAAIYLRSKRAYIATVAGMIRVEDS